MLDEVLLKDFYFYFQYLSFVFAIVYYYKYKSYHFYKFFLVYLLNILVFDILAQTIFRENSMNLFNYYTFFEFNFFALIYYHLIKNKSTLKLMFKLIIGFNIIYFLSFFSIDLTKYTVSIEGVFNSTLIILYFKELLYSDKILNYKKQLPFWISVAFLIFYLTTIPFFALLYSKLFNSRIMFPMLYYLIIVFHLCFIYGFVTCRKMED